MTSDDVAEKALGVDHRITEPTVVMKGLTAKPTRTGFTAVRLHYSADPDTFTPEVIAEEKAALPGWRWRKEYEMDATAQAGMPVFEAEWIDLQRNSVRDPAYRMDIGEPKRKLGFENGEPVWRMDTDESGKLVRRERGRVWIWVPPDSQPHSLPPGVVRLVRQCGIGMDVGEGVGASDSTIQVLFCDNREQAAEFADPNIRPADLGRLAVAVARYYNDALICCVRKLHGLTVLRTMCDELYYPMLWFAKSDKRMVERNSDRLGWSRGEMSDEYLVGPLIDGLKYGHFKLHGLRTVTTLGEYIYDELGRVTHQKRVNIPLEQRRRHGDLVVGLALAERACRDMPLWRNVETEKRRPVEEVLLREQQQRKHSPWRRG